MQKKRHHNASKRQKNNGKNVMLKKLGINLALMATVVTVIIIIAIFALNAYTRHGNELEVPELKGLTVNAAIEKLESMGLVADLGDSVFVKNQRPGTIYAQSLPAGSKVKSGRAIHLTINASQPPMVILPDIADNCSLREATIKLTVLGLQLAPQEYISGEKDWVYGVKLNNRNVSAGQRVPSNAKLTLVVGDGTYEEDMGDSLNMYMPNDGIMEDADLGSETDPL